MNLVKSFFLIFNHLNDYHVCLLCLPFLMQGKDYKKICNIFISITISMCLLVLLKGTLKIPHPKYPHTFSFPSGHAWMVLTACYFLFKDDVKNYRIWVLLVVLIEILVCLFGGHHTIIDVFGGYIIGLIAIILVEIFNKYFTNNILIRTIFTLSFSIFTYLAIYYISNAKVYANGSLLGFIFYNLLIIIFYICILLSTYKKDRKHY